MRLPFHVSLLVAGVLLVLAPVLAGVIGGGTEQAAFHANYNKAIDRIKETNSHLTELGRHQEAVRQANELRPSRKTGDVSQNIGGALLIAAGIAYRFRAVEDSNPAAPPG